MRASDPFGIAIVVTFKSLVHPPPVERAFEHVSP